MEKQLLHTHTHMFMKRKRNNVEGNSKNGKRRKRIRKERVATLKEKLLKKITLYTEGNFTTAEFQEYIKEEAMRLRKESLGTELLHAVGYTYEIRARQHLGRDEFWG